MLKNKGKKKVEEQSSVLRSSRHNKVVGVSYRVVMAAACIFALSIACIQLFTPEIFIAAGYKNVLFATLAVCLMLLVLMGVAIQSNIERIMHLRKVNERVGQKNRSLRNEIDRERRLNKSLHKSENKNREIIDSINDIIFETDERGNIVFLNLAWSNITHFDIEQSIGQSLFSVLHADENEDIKLEFEELVKGRKDRFRTYTQLRHADGTFGAIEISMSRISGGRSSEMRIAGIMTDIEERRRAERALADAEKKYRNIVQNAAGGIYQITPEGMYLSANPSLARVLGFTTPENMLREVKNANESLYNDTAARQAFIQELSAVQNSVHHETQMTRKDGEVIWVSESARAVRDENGQLLFIEGSIEDITERKKSELTIREAKIQSDLANRAKSEFLSNMSHELRTPLNSIIGFSEMIKNEVFGPVGQKAYWEYAKDIHESGQGLLRVINEILDISRIEAGERQLNESMVNIRETVTACLCLLEHKLSNNKLTVTVALDDAPNVVGEELSIKQIVMNLLSNAIKFTPEDGRITISSTTDNEGRFHLSISDTGIGLDDEGIEKAMSPFGQVNSDLNRSGSGTGLGLTLVHSLVKLHGGEFELFSQKGIGTTATIILPASRIAVKTDQVQLENVRNEAISSMPESY